MTPANNPLREGLQFVASDDLLRDDVRTLGAFCKSGAEKNAAIYEPQPASVDQLQCSSGIPLDR